MQVDRQAATLAASSTLRSLSAGKPPPATLEGAKFFHGRNVELQLLEGDLAQVSDRQSVLRFVVGEFGSGKSALLAELADRARRSRFATTKVDIARDRLILGRDGEGRRLLESALLDLRTLGSLDRCAMDSIIGAFRDKCELLAQQAGRSLLEVQREQLAGLERLPRGQDFARIVERYGHALAVSDQQSLQKSRRWLLGQYDSSVQSRNDLGVPCVEDADFWNMMKLWGCFTQLAGRPGLVLILDEIRLMSEVLTGPTRAANFAQLFRIYNDVFSGSVGGIGVFLAMTPNSVTGEFDGLCSEPGLSSCLDGGRLVGAVDDVIGSVAFRLSELAQDDYHSLLLELRSLVERERPGARLIPVDHLALFLEQSKDRLGGVECPYPRDLIREFFSIHNRAAANSSVEWKELLRVHHSPASARPVPVEFEDFAERSM
jgi:hypothetical protein